MMTLFCRGREHEGVELNTIAEDGPLCVAPIWSWRERKKVPGLYLIYLTRVGLNFGPFYADMGLAIKAMKKVLKAFPRGFWEQPVEWYARQKEFQKWVETEMGGSHDLVGAEWA